ALAIDDSGMKSAPIWCRCRQIAASVAGGRPGFPARRHVVDITLLDLVAVDAESARRSRPQIGRWGGSVIDVPVGIEVPVAFADTFDTGCLIERQTNDLVRGAPDRPVGAPSGSARINISVATRGNNVSFAHIRRWPVIAVAIPFAHRSFVDVEAHIERLAHGAHEPRSEIDAPLHETYCRSDNGEGLDQALIIRAQRWRIQKTLDFARL